MPPLQWTTTGEDLPEDTAVTMAMQHLDLQDLTASLQSQASHRPPQPGSTDSGIDLCYADQTHVEVTLTSYHKLPSKATGQRPLEVQLKVLQVPPTPSDNVDQDAQPPISCPDEHDTLKWVAYYCTVDRILGHQIDPDLNLAMRQAAASEFHGGVHHEQETTTPHRDLRSMVNAIWCDKRDLHTVIHSHDTHTQQKAHRIAARLETRRRHLREWHECQAKNLAQEPQRYLQSSKPDKSLKHVDKILGETGHRGIRVVRLQDGTVSNDPEVVIAEVLNSFKRRHNAEHRELSDYTENLIPHLPKLYNRTQRRDIHRTPFTMRELDEVLHNLKPGRTPGVDGLPAEVYCRLPVNLKRHLAARLWDITIGRTDIPPGWANLVHLLYKKRDWANPDNWRPIVCLTTEAKLIWMLILRQVAPVVYLAIPPTMWGAIPGRSPLEAVFMQDAVVDMDPISLIITSLEVKGAFPNTPRRLLRAIWEHMGFPFQGFLQAYLATRLYAVQTDVGTIPWTQRPQGGPTRRHGGPIPILVRHHPAGLLHTTHLPRCGTIPPMDHATGIRR